MNSSSRICVPCLVMHRVTVCLANKVKSFGHEPIDLPIFSSPENFLKIGNNIVRLLQWDNDCKFKTLGISSV